MNSKNPHTTPKIDEAQAQGLGDLYHWIHQRAEYLRRRDAASAEAGPGAALAPGFDKLTTDSTKTDT